MSLSSAEIKNIVEALHKSEWDTASIVVGDVSITVSRNGAEVAPVLAAPAAVAPAAHTPAAPLPAPVAAQPTVTPATGAPAAAIPPSSAATPVEGTLVTAPSVGVFWSAPEPGAEPFAKVGQRVEKGDTLCIIEIMKLMNNVTAEVSGTVVEVHAENAQAVEYGTPLFTIASEG